MPQALSTDRITVRLFGELDLASAPHLEERLDQLRRDGTQQITVDLSGVKFLAAAGLSVFVGADQALQAAGGRAAAHLADPHRQPRLGDDWAGHHAEHPVRAVIGGWISWSIDRRQTNAVAHGAADRPLAGPPLLGMVRSRGPRMVGVRCPCR